MLRVGAILTGMSKTHDGGLRLSFSTQEMPISEQIEALTFHDKFGWLVFKENPISDKEVPKDFAENTRKTMAQRVRGKLYVLWLQTHKSTDDFEQFYKSYMQQELDEIGRLIDNDEPIPEQD